MKFLESTKQRWMSLVGLVLVLLVAAGAVEASSGRAPKDAVPQAGVVDGLHPTMPIALSGARPQPTRTLSATQTQGLESTPWVLVAVKDHARKLSIWYVKGSRSCQQWRGLYVSQSKHRVLVGTFVHSTNANVCDMSLRLGYTVVKLHKPLRSRSLVHVALSNRWKGGDYFP